MYRELNAIRNEFQLSLGNHPSGVGGEVFVETYEHWLHNNTAFLSPELWGGDEWELYVERFCFHTDFVSQLHVYKELRNMGASVYFAWKGFKMKAEENARLEVYFQRQSRWLPPHNYHNNCPIHITEDDLPF